LVCRIVSPCKMPIFPEQQPNQCTFIPIHIAWMTNIELQVMRVAIRRESTIASVVFNLPICRHNARFASIHWTEIWYEKFVMTCQTMILHLTMILGILLTAIL